MEPEVDEMLREDAAPLVRRPPVLAAVPAPAPVAVREKIAIRRGKLPRWANRAVLAGTAAAVLLLALTTSIAKGVLVVAAMVAATTAIGGWSRAGEGKRQAKNRAVTYGVSAAFLLGVIPLVSVLYTTISKGLARFDGAFFSESMRNVIGPGGGAGHAITGTLIVTLIASMIAIPIGIMAAVYLVEYGKGRLKRWLTFFVDVMTGIPSIVAGLFAFALFRIFFGPGIRLGIMAAVALTVLMIPIVVRSTEEMLKVVPASLREASYALGVPKWRTVTKVVLPTALGGIVTGAMLGVARIVGETAPLLITAGAFTSYNTDPLNGRMETLPIFAYYSYKNPGFPPEAAIDRAWAAALTLILIVAVLNLTARFVSSRFGAKH
jgi:phosphate transport system permease protein